VEANRVTIEAADPASPQARRTKIHFQSISKSFSTASGRTLVLDNIELEIPQGDFVSILGESGCGKTTLLRIAAGLIAPSRGKVLIEGQPISKPTREMGFVFQQSVLLEWRSVMENVLLPVEIFQLKRADYREKARDLLRMMGLAHAESFYPVQLSGGMQQRVAIARALILEPSILFMDEPFGALDAITREQMNMELQRIWSMSGSTALFVTHDIAEAVFLSDRVVVLASRPGRVGRIFEVDLPRPRLPEHRFDERFVALCKEMKQCMTGDGA
jgi:NitT/TauT family transport system ATP-binding protein